MVVCTAPQAATCLPTITKTACHVEAPGRSTCSLAPGCQLLTSTLPAPGSASAGAARQQLQELQAAHRGLRQQYSALAAQTTDDRQANRAALDLARQLSAHFGHGWRLLSPEGAALPPPPEWRTVAACTTRHLA